MPWRVIGTIDNKQYPEILSDPNNAASEHGEIPLKADMAVARKRADAVYWCEHQTIYYRLDSGKADEYYLPRPVCVNCRTDMVLIVLFGVSAIQASKD
jgi:hypothetical protein